MEQSKRQAEHSKNKRGVLLAESSYNSPSAQFGLVKQVGINFNRLIVVMKQYHLSNIDENCLDSRNLIDTFPG